MIAWQMVLVVKPTQQMLCFHAGTWVHPCHGCLDVPRCFVKRQRATSASWQSICICMHLHVACMQHICVTDTTRLLLNKTCAEPVNGAAWQCQALLVPVAMLFLVGVAQLRVA